MNKKLLLSLLFSGLMLSGCDRQQDIVKTPSVIDVNFYHLQGESLQESYTHYLKDDINRLLVALPSHLEKMLKIVSNRDASNYQQDIGKLNGVKGANIQSVIVTQVSNIRVNLIPYLIDLMKPFNGKYDLSQCGLKEQFNSSQLDFSYKAFIAPYFQVMQSSDLLDSTLKVALYNQDDSDIFNDKWQTMPANQSFLPYTIQCRKFNVKELEQIRYNLYRFYFNFMIPFTYQQ